jgi:hypothetical protein
MRGAGALVVAALIVLAACSTETPSPVTSVSATAAPVSKNTNCPRTFEFTGTITTSKAADVPYRWRRSDGTASAVHTVHLAAAGTATVVDRQAYTTTKSGWERLETDRRRSGRASFSVTCKPVVTSAIVRVAPTSTRSCTQPFTFSGTITTNGPTSIVYRWRHSDGSTTPAKTIEVSAPAQRRVGDRWLPPPPVGNGWAMLVVSAPNALNSNRATFSRLPRCK